MAAIIPTPQATMKVTKSHSKVDLSHIGNTTKVMGFHIRKMGH